MNRLITYERYDPEKPFVELSDLKPSSKALRVLSKKLTMKMKKANVDVIEETTPLKPLKCSIKEVTP